MESSEDIASRSIVCAPLQWAAGAALAVIMVRRMRPSGILVLATLGIALWLRRKNQLHPGSRAKDLAEALDSSDHAHPGEVGAPDAPPEFEPMVTTTHPFAEASDPWDDFRAAVRPELLPVALEISLLPGIKSPEQTPAVALGDYQEIVLPPAEILESPGTVDGGLAMPAEQQAKQNLLDRLRSEKKDDA